MLATLFRFYSERVHQQSACVNYFYTQRVETRSGMTRLLDVLRSEMTDQDSTDESLFVLMPFQEAESDAPVDLQVSMEVNGTEAKSDGVDPSGANGRG